MEVPVKKIVEFIKKEKYICALILILTFVSIVNTDFTKFLIGWDSLLIELNPWLNFKRNIFSVWEEYQGLGVVAGNAHAVEAFRALIILVIDLFLPLHLVRYFYTYLTIFIGVLSFYFLLKKYTFKGKDYFSFIGALFYLFNLGTVQNYYAPFEPFSAFYAFLPLSVLLILDYLHNEKKAYLYLIIGFVFATLSFQVPTIFIVNSILFAVLFFVLLFKKKDGKTVLYDNFLKVFKTGLTYIGVNLFWLLPFFYFLMSNLSIRFSSLSSRLSIDVAFYQNVRYANLYDLALLRGFWFSNTDYIQGSTGYMMLPWVEWIGRPFILSLGYILFFIILIGLLPLKKNVLYFFSFLTFFISWFFLFNINGLTGGIYEYVVSLAPIVGEIFRFPFTKWIIPITFAHAYFFARGIYFCSYIFTIKKINLNPIKLYVGIIPVVAVILFVFPILKGDLFYSYLRQAIPGDYFETINYFNSKPADRRIALFPINSFWGWQYTSWGYRGSGFLWFGIEQPILSRTFDVWHQNNEQFYHEFQYAIYSEDKELFNYLVKKYQIDYILDDTSVVAPGADRSIFRDGLKHVLNGSNFKLAKSFGVINIYEAYDSDANSFIETPEQVNLVGDTYFFSNIDPNNSLNNPNYFKVDNGAKRFFNDEDLIKDFYENDFKIENLFDQKNGDYYLGGGSFDEDEAIPALIEFDGVQAKINYLYPYIYNSRNELIFSKSHSEQLDIGTSDVSLRFLFNNILLESAGFGQKALINKRNSLVSFSDQSNYQVNFGVYIYAAEVDDCNGRFGDFSKSFGLTQGSVDLTIEKGQMCFNLDVEIENTEPSIYEVTFDHKETTGAKVFYCLYNTETNACLNNKYGSAPDKSATYISYKDYAEVLNKANLKLKMVIEADESNLIKLASLKNIKLTRYKIENAVTYYPTKEAYNLSSSLNLSANEFPLKIDLSNYDDFEQRYLPGDKAFNFSKQNCNIFNQKAFDRALTKDARGTHYKYSAIDAISCDRIDIKKPSNVSYLVEFDIEHLTGKPFGICITGNELDRCVIQDRLVEDERDSFIVPSYDAVDSFSINLDNQSIGGIETSNKLYGLRVKYIPYMWLKQLSLVKEQSFSVKNGLEIESVSKTNTNRYDVTVKARENDVTRSGYIILNQTYSPGWIMYAKKDCVLGVISIFTCNKVSSHVLAKNWANGWIITENALDGEYFIAFTPQFLQIFGYLGGLILVVFTIVLSTIHKKGLVKSLNSFVPHPMRARKPAK